MEIVNRTLKDHFVPMEDKLIQVAEDGSSKGGIIHAAKQVAKLAKGVLYRDDGINPLTGKPIFTKVAENTVTLGGAILALEKLTGKTASFRPKTLNNIMTLNENLTTYDPNKTFVALFGCGIGGAGTEFDDVYDPSPRQNNVQQLLPMMVSANDTLTGTDASKYMMHTSITTDNSTRLNAWYLKEFDSDPVIRSLWKDAPNEQDDGSEITEDVAEEESENGVESFANFKLVITPDDIRSYFIAMGMEKMARLNSIGLYSGEKVMVNGKPEYTHISLFSVLNLNNEPLAERKKIQYFYRVYAMV